MQCNVHYTFFKLIQIWSLSRISSSIRHNGYLFWSFSHDSLDLLSTVSCVCMFNVQTVCSWSPMSMQIVFLIYSAHPIPCGEYTVLTTLFWYFGRNHWGGYHCYSISFFDILSWMILPHLFFKILFWFGLTYHHISPLMLHVLTKSNFPRYSHCGITSYADLRHSFKWYFFCFHWMLLPSPLFVFGLLILFQVGISLHMICYSTFTSQVKSSFFPSFLFYFALPIFSDKEDRYSTWYQFQNRRI